MLADEYPKEVTLKNRVRVTVRLLEAGDYDKLLAFFQALPDHDRLFLQHNVTDSRLIRRWTQRLDFEHVIPLVAEDADRIVADATLHMSPHGWMQHVGQIRLIVAATHRHFGLGSFLAHELVDLAAHRNLEKLYANVIEDDVVSIRLLHRLGFKQSAVLKDLVKDQHGKRRNLVIMLNDVSEVGRILEDWIQDSMIPAFRVPDNLE